MIRPPDPLVTTPTLACAPYGSSVAVRRILDLAYRDCHAVLDFTYGGGGFWRGALPPGLALHANVWPEAAALEALARRRAIAVHSVDYCGGTDVAVGLGRVFDLVIFDPPHVADAGAGGLYRARYGTATGSHGLETNIRLGMQSSMRHASLGVLVKVADHAHGGRWLPLSDWVKEEARRQRWTLHFALQTYRASNTVDPKWKIQRVPRCNASTYLAFRREETHRDFDALYARQENARATA